MCLVLLINYFLRLKSATAATVTTTTTIAAIAIISSIEMAGPPGATAGLVVGVAVGVGAVVGWVVVVGVDSGKLTPRKVEASER